MRYFAPCWALCLRRDMKKMEQFQKRVIRVMREISNLVTRRRIGRNGISLPGEETVMENHKHCHQVPEVVGKSWMHSASVSGGGVGGRGREDLIYTQILAQLIIGFRLPSPLARTGSTATQLFLLFPTCSPPIQCPPYNQNNP